MVPHHFFLQCIHHYTHLCVVIIHNTGRCIHYAFILYNVLCTMYSEYIYTLPGSNQGSSHNVKTCSFAQLSILLL